MSWQQELAAARGVRRWRIPTPIAELEQAVVGLGRHCVQLEGADVEDKTGFLRLCEDAFALPDWFGHNWDALEECLLDAGAGADGAGTVVIWSDWAMFADNEPGEYATALDVFNDTARALGVDGVPFAVLLVGDGIDDGDDAVDLGDADALVPDEAFDDEPVGDGAS